MKGAFVIRLVRETDPASGHFEGSIEEVDSGRELKFRSSTELLRFLGERLQAILVESDSAESPMTRAKRANQDLGSGETEL